MNKVLGTTKSKIPIFYKFTNIRVTWYIQLFDNIPKFEVILFLNVPQSSPLTVFHFSFINENRKNIVTDVFYNWNYI